MSLKIFGIALHVYGLIIGLAILAALEADQRLAKKRGFNKNLIEGLFWWVVGGGIIGARAYHVIDKWNQIYRFNPVSVLYIWNGGLGIWGAVLGGIIGLLIYLKKTQKLENSKTQNPENSKTQISENTGTQKIKNSKTLISVNLKNQSFINLLDITLFGVPLGQAIGRWGNFFNNEIIGKNGEPLFLFESILDLLLFLVLIVTAKKTNKTGTIAGVYLIGYGLIRFVLETLRPTEMIWKLAGVPTAQIVSIIAGLVGMFLIHAAQKS